jgi:hypothetical protein
MRILIIRGIPRRRAMSEIFDLERLASGQGGEYVLGYKDLHSRSCYLIYGVLEPGEGGRLVRPGCGYEEILCAVGGPLVLHTDRGEMTLEKGHALHVTEADSLFLSNPDDSQTVYVLAGGLIGPTE